MAHQDDQGNWYYDDGDVDLVDPHGNPLFSNDPSAGGQGAFGGAIADFVLYGVVNGAFTLGPSQGVGTLIGPDNTLPYWLGPVQVSGNAIICTWVADASSPSGHNLRFTIGPGAAGDEAYVEQIVPVGGTRSRALAHLVRAFFRLAATDGGGTPYAYVTAQYLTAALATTGSAATVGPANLVAAGDVDLLSDPTISLAGAPADALYLRIRIDIARGSLPTTASASIDVTDVRADVGKVVYYVSDYIDPVAYGPADLSQASGVIYLEGVSGLKGPFLKLDTTAPSASLYSQLLLAPHYSVVIVDSATGILLDASNATAPAVILRDYLNLDDELAAAPAAPPSGWNIYARDDDTLRAMDSSGREYLLTAITSQGVFPNGVLTDGSGNALEDAYGEPLYVVDGTEVTGKTFDYESGSRRRIHLTWNGTRWWGDTEEGEWYPMPAWATAGSSIWDTSVNIGRYQRIGGRVLVQCSYLATQTKGTGAGYVRMYGLPYAVPNLSVYYQPNGPCMLVGWTWAGIGLIVAMAEGGSSDIIFEGYGSAGTPNDYAGAAQFAAGPADFRAHFSTYYAVTVS